MSTLKTQPPSTYRARLQDLCSNGRLKIILVIAPPRTNSTIVEHILGYSPSVDQECHEPFFGAGRSGVDPDNGYKQIYDSVGGEVFEKSSAAKTVVVKDIAHWVHVGKAYEELFELTNFPIVFLIRNPLLSVESRLQRILTTLPQKVEMESLNAFAHKAGAEDWNVLLTNKFVVKDYRFFEPFLLQHAGWATSEESDFQKMDEQITYADSTQKAYVIVDTTDLRATPETLLTQLCANLGIEFSPMMINWKQPSANFYTTQDPQRSRAWYGAVQDSTHIKPPSEVPPAVSFFPASLQVSLITSSLPIYYRLARKKLQTATAVNNIQIAVEVTDANKNLLTQLGVITNAEGSTLVPLGDIDPVYARTNNPDLVKDWTYMQQKTAYATEISLA